jgi:hypothetical protein
MSVYGMSEEAPVMVHFAVIETIESGTAFTHHYSRPYPKIKTARMRLSTLMRDVERSGIACTGWVVSYDLSSVAEECSEW